MNRLRHAEEDMRCLGAYWRHGWDGPPEHPKTSSAFLTKPSPPPAIDEERAKEVFVRWIRVLERDTHLANVLVFRYRDKYKVSSRDLRRALRLLADT